jgi:hypothetical protein
MIDLAEALAPYLYRLRELPFVRGATVNRVAASGDRDIDAVVAIRTLTGSKRLATMIKRSHLTREVGLAMVRVGASRENLLLLAPAVGRDLGKELAAAGINYMDLAGNCDVRLGRQYVAHVEGRRAEAPAAAKSFRAPAFRVLLALLINPALAGATSRTLAEAAGGVSAQTALDLRERLLERAILVRKGTRLGWRPRGRREALDILVAGFTATLRPSLSLGNFRPMERSLAQLETNLQDVLREVRAWRWGGGAACERLTGHFRGDRTHVYVLGGLPSDLPAKLRLLPDPDGALSFAQCPGPLAFDGPQPHAVHPLLAYLDLLSESEPRAREAAQEIYERFLATELGA